VSCSLEVGEGRGRVLGILLGLLTHVEPTTKPPTAAAITPRTKAILAGMSLDSTVTIDEMGLSPKDALAHVLTPLGLAYIVKDDVPIVGDPGARRGSNLGRPRVG
jgi:hypothetical protein